MLLSPSARVVKLAKAVSWRLRVTSRWACSIIGKWNEPLIVPLAQRTGYFRRLPGCSLARPWVRWKSIEIGVDIGASGNLSDDNVGRQDRIGRTVATVAKRDPAVRHSWNPPNEWQPRGRFTKGTCPCKFDSGIERRQEAMQLALKYSCFAGEQVLAQVVLREVRVFPTADDTTFRHCSNVEVGFRRLPDATFTRP